MGIWDRQEIFLHDILSSPPIKLCQESHSEKDVDRLKPQVGKGSGEDYIQRKGSSFYTRKYQK